MSKYLKIHIIFHINKDINGVEKITRRFLEGKKSETKSFTNPLDIKRYLRHLSELFNNIEIGILNNLYKRIKGVNHET